MPYIEPEDYRPEQPLRPQITGPLGWEDGTLPWHQRLYRTLSATFAPLDSLHAVAHGDVAPALRFALLSALPFMLLWAVVPYTHTLRFGPSFELAVLKDPGGLPIELDVVRAVAIGLAIESVSELAWALPFVSLLAAFSNGSQPEDPKRAGWRTVLYRVWVVPFGITLICLLMWGLPAEPNVFVLELASLGLRMLPRVLMLVHCHVMARYFGASGFGAFVVSVVPWIVQLTVQLSLDQLALKLQPILPAS